MGLWQNIMQRARRAVLGRVSDPSWVGGSSLFADLSEPSALGLTAYYCGVDLISSALAMSPCHLYQRLDGGGREKARDARQFDLMTAEPNPEQTAYRFKKYLTTRALGWGNGYAEIVRDGAGRPAAMWPLEPGRVRPTRNAAGELVYEVSNPDRPASVIPARNMLHIRGLGGELEGWSPVRLFAHSLGRSLAAEKSGGSFYENNATPSLKVSHPFKGEDKERFIADWLRKYQGASNAGRVAFVQPGVEAEPIGINPKDAQFIETLEFGVRDVSRILHVPAHMLAELSRATFSNISEQSLEYLRDCIGPWFTHWEQECDRKLLSRASRRVYYFRFNSGALLKVPLEKQNEALNTAVQGGWMTPNEARALQEMNPLPGGDELLRPLNTEPSGGETPPAEPDDDEPEEGDDDAD